MQSSPFRALGHYRVLPQIAGWKSLIVAFAARAPYAMIPLGVMTAVSATTGSVAEGGYATASVALSTSIAGPLIGKWADRRGQHLPLRILTPLNALALLGLSLAVANGFSGLPLYALGVLVGATSLPIGSFTRSRWISHTTVPHELNAALSYESMADELVFVLGPALVGIAASAAAPTAPLFLAFALIASAGLIFAYSSPRTHTKQSLAAPAGPGVLRVLWAVSPSIVVMTSIGMFFGATQAATTMRAEIAGAQGLAGLVYAAMGVGSAAMAIMTVAIPERISLPQRLLIGGLGMAIFIAVVGVMPNLGLTALALAIAGMFVGPSMVTAFTVSERLAPEGGVAIAMTSMQSSITIGVSIGSAVGGSIAQNFTDTPTFLAAAVTGIVLALVGLTLSSCQFLANR